MAIFWACARNVFAAFGLVAAAAGAAEVVPWGLAFTAVTVCFVVVRLGHSCKVQAERRARDRARRKHARLALADRLLAADEQARRAA